jgi:hypothetical protein
VKIYPAVKKLVISIIGADCDNLNYGMEVFVGYMYVADVLSTLPVILCVEECVQYVRYAVLP